MENQPTPAEQLDAARVALVAEAIGPVMLIGLQDAELFDQPGTERIGEWIKWISETVAALPAEFELRGTAEIRAAALTEAADFVRDAHFRDGLSVQEIGTALRHWADRERADEAQQPTTGIRIPLPGIPECPPGCFCRRSDEVSTP